LAFQTYQRGSGGLVNRFTGQNFALGTSIGIGPVLELYGNYGNLGVWIGFIVLGGLVKTMDAMAGYHLVNGTWTEFAKWFSRGNFIPKCQRILCRMHRQCNGWSGFCLRGGQDIKKLRWAADGPAIVTGY